MKQAPETPLVDHQPESVPGSAVKKKKPDDKTKVETDNYSDNTGPYRDITEYLSAELAYLDMVLLNCVHSREENSSPETQYNPLFFEKGYIQSLFSRPPAFEPPPQTTEKNAGMSSSWKSEELENKRAEIQKNLEESLASGNCVEYYKLASIFQLTEFEFQVLVIALAPLIDNRYSKIYGYLQDDISLADPTLHLLYQLFANGLQDVAYIRDVLSGSGNLATGKLIRLREPYANNAAIISYSIDPRIADYLLGGHFIDSEISGYLQVLEPRSEDENSTLSSALQESLRNFCTLYHSYGKEGGAVSLPAGVIFPGDAPDEKREAVRLVANELQSMALSVDTPSLAGLDESRFSDIVDRIFRESLLTNAVLYFQEFDALSEREPYLELFFQKQQRAFGYSVLLLDANVILPPKNKNSFAEIRFDIPEFKRRKEIWAQYLHGSGLNGSLLDTLSDRFQFNIAQIRNTVQTAQIRKAIAGRDQLEDHDIFYGSSRQSFHDLDRFGVRIVNRHEFSDIVLPSNQIEQLKAVIAAYRQKRKVYEEWGFQSKVLYGKGLSLMFAGPSGTGKTMAATIMATELGLDMYKIDLSTVVSKYIGETEKNLSKIFKEAQTADSILFFDEADAIFGKRTEVKDAHDRYANIETGYLLQKMEEYDGVTILATNFRQNIDEAFKRRIKFIVEFPHPDVKQRKEIWQKCYPAQAPIDKAIDFQFLAEKVTMTGGHIKNMVVYSAICAAQDDEPIQMKHILQAVRKEYQKEAKAFHMQDFEPYSGELSHA